MENKLTPGLIEKARQAKSPEELLVLAKENEIELTEDEAKAYFEQLNKSGELSDDELDNVAGGGCYTDDGRLVVTPCYSCKRYECKVCGNTGNHLCKWSSKTSVYTAAQCSKCKYCTKSGVRMLCNHPLNYKR
ncbi:MAG: hypothetical protein K2N06_06000 [Oscillospiraceae bacterium]|nr:hypothetical protein [Oscillospiraceae bacterium]